MVHARHHRKEPLLLDAFAPGQRQRPHRSPMEGAHERHELTAPRLIPGELDGRFNRFGP